MLVDCIKSIIGMYILFWMFDLNSEVQVRVNCIRVNQYEEGDYICIEIEYFEVFCDINFDYLKIFVDVFEKMNDELMDKLEFYLYDQLKDF